MKYLKTIRYGVLLWILIFFEVSILMFGFGLENGIAYYRTHYILAILLVILVTMLYFRKEKASLQKGILAGVVFASTGMVLDVVITVPLLFVDVLGCG